MRSFLHDLRYATRLLAKTPGFTAVAVITLALGIGANSAIFAVLDAVLLKRLPVNDSDGLYLVHRYNDGVGPHSYSFPIYQDIRDRQQVLSAMTAVAGQETVYRVTLGEQFLDPLRVQIVSGDYFSVLGVRAASGRFFTAAEDKGAQGAANEAPGATPVAVISHQFWQRQFGENPTAVGSTIKLNSTVFTVLGVAPRGFFGDAVGSFPDLWVPIMMQPQVMNENSLAKRTSHWLKVYARLKPGITPLQASSALTALYREVGSDQPSTPETKLEIRLQQAAKGWPGIRRLFAQPLWILMSAAGVVLLIACCNLSNLFLARAVVRRREIGVRRALGAGRWRLARQLLTESGLLAVIAGAVALLVAQWGAGFLLRLASDPSDPVLLDLRLDWRLAAFTALLSLVTGILFGLLPALQATRLDINVSRGRFFISGALGAAQAPRGQRFMPTLVVAQVALSLTLLIAAGLFVRTLQKLRSIDAGFDRKQIVLVTAGDDDSSEPPVPVHEYRSLHERLNSMSGVRSASFSLSELLQSGGWNQDISTPQPLPTSNRKVWLNSITPGYFETTGMQLLQGRSFHWNDHEKSPRVAIVNETFVRRFFTDKPVLGERFSIRKEFRPDQAIEIVGVVRDARYHELRESGTAMAYLPILQTGQAFSSVEVRTATGSEGVASQIRRLLQESGILVRDVRTLEEQADRSLAREHMFARLCGAFSMLGLTIACVGLYGVLSYSVARRTHEIGVRMALGADRRDVVRLVLGHGMRPLAIGIVLGCFAAAAASRLISNLLFGVSPLDPLTFVSTGALLVAVGLLASLIPAWRAVRVDPVVALRCE